MKHVIAFICCLIAANYSEDILPSDIICKYTIVTDKDTDKDTDKLALALILNSDRRTLKDFSVFCRALDNPKWRDDKEQMTRHETMLKQIDEEGSICLKVLQSSDAISVRKSNLRFQNAVNKWHGKIIFVDVLPGPSIKE